jgi:hypothetical protein
MEITLELLQQLPAEQNDTQDYMKCIPVSSCHTTWED